MGMTKREFVKAVKEKAGADNVALTEKIIDATFDLIAEQLKQGNEVSIFRFGKFGVRQRGEKTGINPVTKEKIKIKARKVPYFKPSRNLKEAVK